MPASQTTARASSQRRALQLLRVLVDALTSSARAVEERTGVTNAQLFLLQTLAADGPLGIGELAARARTQSSTVSIVIGRLVRARLVRKSRGGEDGRRAIVTLTAAGRRLAARAPVAPTARVIAALDALDPREARGLVGGLEILVRGLEPSATAAPMLFEARRARRKAVPR